MSDHQLADWRQHALALETEVNKVVVGQAEPVRLITTAIFARGHVLLEGDVGVGKTPYYVPLHVALAAVISGLKAPLT